MVDCGWCDGEGAADWLYDADGSATALEAYLPKELEHLMAGGSKIVRGEHCEECHGTGELFENEDGEFDWVSALFAYEEGELDTRTVIQLFAELIKTGKCYTLQGSYGRMALRLINAELIDREGTILWDNVNERIDA